MSGLSVHEIERELGAAAGAESADGQEPPFPDAAWRGFFGTWRDVVAPCTEAPLESLWAACLVAAGLVLGRSVWKETPQPLYPNFFVLLLGNTGDSRKSTVLWLAEQLLFHTGEDIEILRGIVSTEGIFERMAKKDDTRALGYADEFRALLSVARRKGTGDLLPKLNSLYGCPARDSIDRREKSTTIIRPFFSLVTATPRDYVHDVLTSLEVSGGLLNRFLIVEGQEQAPKPFVKSPSRASWESVAGPLHRIREDWAGRAREMDLSAEAREVWREFYTAWRLSRKQWDAQAAKLTARTHEHVLKIAIVYSALAGDAAIGADSLATAIKIGGWLERRALELFGDVGLNDFARAEKAVVEILKRKGRMKRRELQQQLGNRLDGEQFARALKSLEVNGHVVTGEERKPSGQKSKWVQAVSHNT